MTDMTDINREVAHMMGWSITFEEDGILYGFLRGSKEKEKVPDYLTDPAAAMEVEAEMMRKGYECKIEHTQRGLIQNFCVQFIKGLYVKGKASDHKFGKAICRAALTAMEE